MLRIFSQKTCLYHGDHLSLTKQVFKLSKSKHTCSYPHKKKFMPKVGTASGWIISLKKKQTDLFTVVRELISL